MKEAYWPNVQDQCSIVKVNGISVAVSNPFALISRLSLVSSPSKSKTSRSRGNEFGNRHLRRPKHSVGRAETLGWARRAEKVAVWGNYTKKTIIATQGKPRECDHGRIADRRAPSDLAACTEMQKELTTDLAVLDAHSNRKKRGLWDLNLEQSRSQKTD